MNSENETIQIRLANDNDFEAILLIWLDGISNSFEYNEVDLINIKEKFTSNFFQRQGIFNFWVAFDSNNNIYGWQSLIRASNNPFRQNTYAESSTYISKNSRFKGLGKLLLAHAMKQAEESELLFVIGFVTLSNEASKKITRETGWIDMGIFPVSKKISNEYPKNFLVRPV